MKEHLCYAWTIKHCSVPTLYGDWTEHSNLSGDILFRSVAYYTHNILSTFVSVLVSIYIEIIEIIEIIERHQNIYTTESQWILHHSGLLCTNIVPVPIKWNSYKVHSSLIIEHIASKMLTISQIYYYCFYYYVENAKSDLWLKLLCEHIYVSIVFFIGISRLFRFYIEVGQYCFMWNGLCRLHIVPQKFRIISWNCLKTPLYFYL